MTGSVLSPATLEKLTAVVAGERSRSQGSYAEEYEAQKIRLAEIAADAQVIGEWAVGSVITPDSSFCTRSKRTERQRAKKIEKTDYNHKIDGWILAQWGMFPPGVRDFRRGVILGRSKDGSSPSLQLADYERYISPGGFIEVDFTYQKRVDGPPYVTHFDKPRSYELVSEPCSVTAPEAPAECPNKLRIIEKGLLEFVRVHRLYDNLAA